MSIPKSVPSYRPSHFLGVVSSKGVSADPDKIKVIIEWPEPCNIREVRSFHGLSYFLQAVYLKF